jgi:PAS domain S-box-containing protein
MLNRVLGSSAYRTLLFVFLLIGLAGVGFTAFVFFEARESAVANYRLQFELDASLRASLIERALADRLWAVRALSRLMRDKTDPGSFSLFTSVFPEEKAGVQAFGWAPRVRRGERPPVAITEKEAGGSLVPAGEREEYFPVLYVEPLKGNQAALGYDLASEPVRRAALDRARQTGEPAASGRITLVQDPSRRSGFLLAAPVAGKDGVAGFATATICFEELLRVALENTPALGLPFELADLSAGASSPRPLEQWTARLEPARSWKRWFLPPSPVFSRRFPFAGREWEIAVTANDAYAQRHFPVTHWLLLPPGLLLSLFLPLFLRAFLMRREELMGLVRERTRELRESEERFRLILDSTHDAILVIDAGTGEILQANRQAEKMGGWSPGEVARAGLANLVQEASPWSMTEARELMRRAMEEGPQFTEWQARGKAGETVWVEIALRTITLGGGRRLLATVRDIGQRKGMEAETARGQKLEAISALAGGIGHDINNLLTALRGNLSLAKMMEKTGKDGVAERLAGAEEACGQIGALVERLMVFSRETRVEKVACAIPLLVEEAARAVLGDGPVKLAFAPAPGLWETLAERPLLLQALRSLFENAREAMPGGGEVEVSAKNLAPAAADRPPSLPRGEYIALAIRDHGRGIPEAALPRIFEPYYSTKATPAVKGLGLSLGMVYAIVARQGGFITVESGRGGGATFHLFLPRVSRSST